MSIFHIETLCFSKQRYFSVKFCNKNIVPWGVHKNSNLRFSSVYIEVFVEDKFYTLVQTQLVWKAVV
jgi:hypothetical protein